MYIFFFLAAVVAAPLPVSVNVFSNSGLAGSPVLYAFPSLSLTVPAQAQPYYSAEVTTQVAVTPGWWAFDCAGAFGVGVSLGYVWVDDHLVCAGSGANQSSPYANKVSGTDGTLAYPIFARPGSGRATWLIRAHLYVNASGGFVSGPSFSFPWCSPAAPGAPCAFSPIPPGALAAGLPPGEAARASLQRSLATGWGLWLHDNILTAALLPAGLRLSLAVCPLGGGGSCATAAVPDDGNVRVGAHASDRSIAQFFVGAPGVNVSVTVLGGAELSVLVEAVGGAGAGANYAVAVSADFVWRRGGAVASDGAVLTAAPAGLPVVAVRGGGGAAVDPDALPPAVRARPLIALSLAAGAVAFGTAGGAPPSVPAVRAAADVAAAVEAARYLKYGDLAEAAQGVHAAVAWNMIFTPAEVGPVPPVSRSWSAVRSNPAEADPGQWGYVIFAWDNQLAALLAGLNSGPQVTYSALIQAVRSRTAQGFVPNYSAGGGKSVDRTEPPLAGRVLRQLHAKFNDTWIVEFLMDDLLDNLDWFWRKRVTPLGLIALGSDPVVNYTWEAGGVGAMQGARWESGLDNSPMYDGRWYSNSTHQMEGADVGMSSLFVAEAAAVAALARAVNRSGDADALDARAGSVRAQISLRLWDDARGIFANRFAIGGNTSLSARIAPTSFYALGARAATDAQAARMANEWLFNATRFCLSETWPAGVSPNCWWGLPSISADDPAFPLLGYWRGYVWGPMAQIVFWALEEYAHVPEVAAAKAALAKQHGAMFLEQWRLRRNVCENYSPKQGAGGCTGTPFYSWGALAALMQLQEQGMY